MTVAVPVSPGNSPGRQRIGRDPAQAIVGNHDETVCSSHGRTEVLVHPVDLVQIANCQVEIAIAIPVPPGKVLSVVRFIGRPGRNLGEATANVLKDPVGGVGSGHCQIAVAIPIPITESNTARQVGGNGRPLLVQAHPLILIDERDRCIDDNRQIEVAIPLKISPGHTVGIRTLRSPAGVGGRRQTRALVFEDDARRILQAKGQIEVAVAVPIPPGHISGIGPNGALPAQVCQQVECKPVLVSN